MTIANHIGREPIIEVGDKKYKLSRFTRKLSRELMEWVEKQFPDPIEKMKRDIAGLPLELQKQFVDDYIQHSRQIRTMDSPEVENLLHTKQGAQFQFSLLFRQYHPELTEVDIENIYDQATAEHGYNYVERAILEATGFYTSEELDKKMNALIDMGLLPEKKG